MEKMTFVSGGPHTTQLPVALAGALFWLSGMEHCSGAVSYGKAWHWVPWLGVRLKLARSQVPPPGCCTVVWASWWVPWVPMGSEPQSWGTWHVGAGRAAVPAAAAQAGGEATSRATWRVLGCSALTAM